MAKDLETLKIEEQAAHIEAMLNTDGWALVKARFDQKILDLQNINNIDSQSADTMVADIKARKMAVDILFNFLKFDVYGVIEQASAAEQTLIEKKSDIIDRQ